MAESDHRFAQAVAKAARRVGPQGPAPAAVAGVLQRVFERPGWMRLFFEVLPVVLRDEELRSREAAFLDSCARPAALLRREGAGEDESILLALLSQSLVIGLAIQKLVDPRGTPVSAAVEAWQALLEQ